jgi:hypothetical protein
MRHGVFGFLINDALAAEQRIIESAAGDLGAGKG